METFREFGVEPPKWVEFMVECIVDTLCERARFSDKAIKDECVAAVTSYMLELQEREAVRHQLRKLGMYP